MADEHWKYTVTWYMKDGITELGGDEAMKTVCAYQLFPLYTFINGTVTWFCTECFLTTKEKGVSKNCRKTRWM